MSELLSVPLVSKDGIRGRVLTTSRLLDDSPEKSVVFEGGERISVANKHLHLRPDGTYFLDLAVQPGRTGTQTPKQEQPAAIPMKPAQGDAVIPVIQETAQITKRTVETGRVRVRKTVEEKPVSIDEDTLHTEYEVVRVPVNRVVDAIAPTRSEGDTTIIPVYEEETVTVTRLVLREEVHLVKKQTVKRRARTIVLRKDKVEVERVSQSAAKE